jgi:hypothetical protein
LAIWGHTWRETYEKANKIRVSRRFPEIGWTEKKSKHLVSTARKRHRHRLRMAIGSTVNPTRVAAGDRRLGLRAAGRRTILTPWPMKPTLQKCGGAYR